MENQIQTRKKIEERLIEKAMKDDAFRKQLMDNPRETIEQELRVSLPPSVNIHVLQEEPATFYLVLPPAGKEVDSDLLSEADLRAVAGGGDGYSISGCDKTYALFCHD